MIMMVTLYKYFAIVKKVFSSLAEFLKICNYDTKKNMCALKGGSGDSKKGEIMSCWGIQLYPKQSSSDDLVREVGLLIPPLRPERLKRAPLPFHRDKVYVRDPRG
jgi:hypothetical protein